MSKNERYIFLMFDKIVKFRSCWIQLDSKNNVFNRD